jgi:hypothetical protein
MTECFMWLLRLGYFEGFLLWGYFAGGWKSLPLLPKAIGAAFYVRGGFLFMAYCLGGDC